MVEESALKAALAFCRVLWFKELLGPQKAAVSYQVWVYPRS